MLIVSGAVVVSLAGPASAFGPPVANWHMGGLGADDHTMRDSSSSDPSNDGTTTDVKVVDGWNRHGYKFNGSTSQVVVPNQASLNPGRLPIRIVTYAKFRFLPASGNYALLTKGDVTSRHYKLLINSVGQAVCQFKGSRVQVSVRSARLQPRKRHQIICGKMDRRVWIRVDGIKTIAKVRVGRISNVRRLLLGTGYAGGSHFRGGLDETTIQVEDDSPPPPPVA
jgi:hypothetical protein